MFWELILAILALLSYLYIRYVNKFNYWKKLGVPCLDRAAQTKNNWDQFLKRKSHHQLKREEYDAFKGERFYGKFDGFNQILTIRDDFDLIRSVMVKDFDHFGMLRLGPLRNIPPANKVEEVILKGILVVYGSEWKNVRSTFSPIFSSGKLKQMMHIFEKTNVKFDKQLGECADNGEMIELKHYFGKYSMDIIASCVFGVNAGAFDEKESDFVKFGKQFFAMPPLSLIRMFLIVPNLNNTLKKILMFCGMNKAVSLPNETANKFFVDVVQSIIKTRRQTKVKNNDMIDLMIEALDNFNTDNNNEADDEHSKEQFEVDAKIKGFVKPKKKLDEEYIIGTAITMMQAGFDTTALTMSFMIYELALNPEYQKILQDELDDTNLDNYTELQNLPYLDAVIHETLRKYPGAAALERTCMKDYKVPGSNIVIKKGQKVNVNRIGISYDPKYFPNPEKFNPDNFSKENRALRDPYTFLGFSQGPRNCIAMRFALLEVKICIAHLLTRFNFLPCEKTKRKFEIDRTTIFGGIAGGFWVKCERRLDARED